MNILMVHNSYRQRGGEDISAGLEADLLRSHGHRVDVLERDNSDIPEIDRLSPVDRLMTGIRLGAQTTWSPAAREETGQRLAADHYDLVHVQNFFPQLSPSVLYAAADAGVPVVMTLRNYRISCAKGTFYRDGAVCEACLGKPVALPAIRFACYQDNRAATSAVVAMQATHRALRTWRKKVTIYVALTNFAKDKAVEMGLPADRIVTKPNFLAPDPGQANERGSAFVFAGRLNEEKGVDTLLAAFKRTDQTIRIVGGGPLANKAHEAAARRANIEYLGELPPEQVLLEMGRAKAVIVPSLWYETFGRVIIESLAVGTPIIASDIGAVAELIDPGVTGVLVPPGDVAALSKAIEELADDDHRRHRMGADARSAFEDRYTSQKNYPQLMSIYERAMSETTS